MITPSFYDTATCTLVTIAIFAMGLVFMWLAVTNN